MKHPFQFYFKTPNGFEKIIIISIDYDTELITFRFITESEDVNHTHHCSKIVQLQVIPTVIQK